MEKYNYLLWCIHEFVQVEIYRKIEEKNLQNQAFINAVFPDSINHECTKALLAIDDASVPTDFLKDICTVGSSWPRKAIEALVAGYKKEFLNPDIFEEGWKRIAEHVKQHGQVVNIPVCRMKLNNLFRLHLEVKCNQNEIELDSEQRYCYQLIEALFSQPKTKHTESSTLPLKKRKLKSTATENEQNPEPGCSIWQIN